jgi:hypothetical protein
MDETKKVGGMRPGSGRKRLQAGVSTVLVGVKMTEPQRAKLQRLGGAHWVRDRIDRAKEPTPKE